MRAFTWDAGAFHDYVVSHGGGPPSLLGYWYGQYLILTGDDYATAAFEVVFRNWVE